MSFRCAVIVLTVFAFGYESFAENWPGWRGPGGRGVAVGTGYPLTWSETENLAWKTPIPGTGHSSPVVWGDRIFVTTAIEIGPVDGATAVTHYAEGQVYRHPDSVGGDTAYRLQLVSLDRRTGTIIWTTTLREGTPYDDRHRQNTYASATPVTDGSHVWAFFDAEGIYCTDFDGNLVWKKDVARIAKAGLGPGTSPVLYKNLVILQVDQQGMGVSTDPDRPTATPRTADQGLSFGEDSFIVALDKRTGEQIWRTPRDSRRSWATPTLIPTAGGVQMITSAAEAVIAYDPETGRELWKGPGVRSHPIPSPVYDEEMVIVAAGSGRKHALGLRLAPSGDDERLAWHYQKGTAYVVSPLLYQGLLYLTSNGGVVTALDPATGQVLYDDGRLPPGARFWSSPVGFEGRILVADDAGNCHVMKAGPAFAVLASNKLDEPIWASPAVANGQILIRGDKSLYAFELQN